MVQEQYKTRVSYKGPHNSRALKEISPSGGVCVSKKKTVEEQCKTHTYIHIHTHIDGEILRGDFCCFSGHAYAVHADVNAEKNTVSEGYIEYMFRYLWSCLYMSSLVLRHRLQKRWEAVLKPA